MICFTNLRAERIIHVVWKVARSIAVVRLVMPIRRDDGYDWDVKSNNSDEYESCWYEQNGNYDSTTGYANCWICKKELCDQHFERHYEKCRSMVSTCCSQFAVVTALINAGIPMKQESIIMLTEFVAHPVAKNVP